MFFPKLLRSAENEYYSARRTFYADYRQNYKLVAIDCKNRCVYCDITIEEYGGDEMHLDHFRPQEHFQHLATHPYNLYLSCPKCNGLKTSDWPCAKEAEGVTFVGSIGYLDRFSHDLDVFLQVDSSGKIIPIAGPASYMIKKMHLNRVSRVNVRRKRLIAHRKTRFLQGILKLTDNLQVLQNEGKLSAAQASEKRAQIDALLHSYAKL